MRNGERNKELGQSLKSTIRNGEGNALHDYELGLVIFNGLFDFYKCQTKYL